MEKIRLQKLLANAGYGSRREIERLIAVGKITVNSRVAKLGDLASFSDIVKIYNKRITLPITDNDPRIIIYNKPAGEICSRHDPKNRPTVYDKLPKISNGRWIGVGRLDFNTSGLYIFTNDGELVNLLIQPNSKIPRKYLVKASRILDNTEIKNLKNGVEYKDKIYSVDYIKLSRALAKSAWYIVQVSRGRNHEIKNIFQSQGVLVSRLVRISYADFDLPKNLKKGHFLELPKKLVENFKQSIMF